MVWLKCCLDATASCRSISKLENSAVIPPFEWLYFLLGNFYLRLPRLFSFHYHCCRSFALDASTTAKSRETLEARQIAIVPVQDENYAADTLVLLYQFYGMIFAKMKIGRDSYGPYKLQIRMHGYNGVCRRSFEAFATRGALVIQGYRQNYTYDHRLFFDEFDGSLLFY